MEILWRVAPGRAIEHASMREVCELMKINLKDLENGARKQLAPAVRQAGQPDMGGAGDEAEQAGSAA